MRYNKRLFLFLWVCAFIGAQLSLANQNSAIAKVNSNLPVEGSNKSINDQHFKVLKTYSNKIQIEFSYAIPEYIQDNSKSLVQSKTKAHQVLDKYYQLPFFSYPILGKILSAKTTYLSSKGSLKNIDLKPLVSFTEDSPIGLGDHSEKQVTDQTTEVTNPFYSVIKWNYVGSMRGKDISYLHIYPYRYFRESSTLQFNQKIIVEITFSDAASISSFQIGLNEAQILNNPTPKKQVSKINTRLNLQKGLASQTLSSRTISTLSEANVFGSLPVIPKYKIIVDEDGVYQIGYFEFQDEEFPEDFFKADPRTFRLFNKGIEIPIIVSGEEDGEFDRNDYIEFLGESHKIGLEDPDRPDMYNDPYTNKNIYYLYWEPTLTSANKGLRMVEVPAQIRRVISSGTSFNLKGRSFRSTLHFEEDNIIRERMSGFYSRFNQEEYAKTRNHSDARDLNFWTPIDYGRSTTFNIVVPSPDFSVSIDPESLRVRAAFHSKSIVNLNGKPQNTALLALGKPSAPFIVTETSWGEKVYADRNKSRQELNLVDVKLPITQQRLLDESGLAVIQITNRDNISTGTTSRSFYFNWLNITYRRLYEAYNDELTFKAPPSSRPGLYQFQINGFKTPEIDIYKKDVGKLSNFNVEKYSQINADNVEENLYRVIFQDNVINPNDVSYIALPSDHKKIPSAFKKVERANVFEPEISLQNTSNNYNYIIITTDQFINEENKTDDTNPVKKYKDYRESSLGFYNESNNVLVTTVEGIYDEFNYGIKSPHAIRNFLNYAYNNWSTSPTYVLLLGDASRNNESQDLVPTMHVQTLRFGATGADVWYTMIDGYDESGRLDLLPELQISRVPAKTLTDIDAYLNKLKKYELYVTDPSNASIGEWQNQIVFVAGETGSESIGSQSVRKDVFVVQTDNLIENYIQRNFFINRLHTNLGRNAVSNVDYQDIYRGSRSDMEQFLNTGCLILNFVGHGGGAIWSDSQVMTLSGVDRLNNFESLPFVTSMTCFTGAFDDPSYSVGTLSEKMILTPEKGAIGFIGSAGLGWLINDDIMARSIFNFLLDDENKNLSIGDLLFQAKTRYYLDNIYFWDQAPSMIYQYGIFGDPALRLAHPFSKTDNGEDILNYNLDAHILSIGDTLTFTCDIKNFNTGVAKWVLTDDYNFDTELNPNNILFVQSGKLLQNVDGFLTDTIKIPIVQPLEVAYNNNENFAGGQLKLFIQGSGSNAGKAIHGNIPISANGPYFKSFGPETPIQNAVDQPLKFSAQIDSRYPIDFVELRITIEEPNQNLEFSVVPGWNNKLISALETTQNTYVTSTAVPASIMKKGNRITYNFVAQNSQFNVAYSETKTEIVGNLPDLAAYPQANKGMLQFFDNSSIDFYTDNDSVVIGSNIYNWSSLPAENVTVYFYESSIRNGDPRKSSYQGLNKPLLTNDNIIGHTTISVGANQHAFAKIGVPSDFELSQTYSVGIKVVSDTNQSIYEETYTNNLSNEKNIVYDILHIDNTTINNIALDKNLYLSFAQSTFSKSGFLNITKLSNPTIVAQPDNQFIRFKDQRIDTILIDENFYAYEITSLDTSLILKKPITLRFEFDTNDELFLQNPSEREKVGGYYYASNLDRWIKLVNQIQLDSATISMTSNKFGTFSVLYSSDVTNPIANLGIDGQYYSSGSFAPKKARIIATLQDQNGINLDPQFITVIKDGDSSESLQSKLTIPENALNANSVGISFSDEFDPGNHEVTFVFHDTNLNQTRSEKMVFQVENDYSLKVFGNFPNPFTDETDIAYEIIGGESANTLEFKIYTVSGRLVTTFNQQSGKVLGFTPSQFAGADNDARTVGLHIYRWDGTDKDGNSVANGVYFCKIKASFKGNVQEEIIKIARIR